MPSLLLPRFSLQDMSDKKSPPRKEKPFVVRTPQPDDKGMKRKLLSPASPTHDDDDKKTPNKRKRGSLSLEASPMTNPKTPGGGSRSVPLSERQQLAMIMRMSDESTQENTLRPSSPTALLPGIKKSQLDKKVFKRNERGEMPIHLAAIKGDIKLLKKLIKAGADVNVADFAGWTPLHEASNRGWLYIAKQLLKAGANVNVQGLENDTPLHDASINGHTKLVELLLKHGANPLQQNAKGKTPLDVAPSTDMVKILKKETICSGSDTSSIEDVRSPMSPDSVLSLKDDDKSLDSEDMHQNNRSESFSSSSSNRRLSMPKSPDGKLSSPRLCLKFHRDNFGYTNQKSLDSNEPQYKSYSVTNMSVDSNIDTPMFSPSDSPASSVDSDLYNPGLDNFTNFSGSKLKISLPDDENSKFDSRSNLMIPALRLDGNSLNEAKEVFPDKATDKSDENSDHNSIVGTTSDINSSKSVLKPMETLPFNANVQWSESRNEDSLDLPDLEIDTSDPIPVNSYKNNGISDFVQECNLVSSSSVKSPGQSGVNHSSVTSSTELQQPPELLNSETEKSVTNSVVTSNSTNDCPKQSDEADNQSDNIVKLTELSSNTVTSAESADSCLCSMSSSKTEDSDKINNIVPCSPNRTERDSKDSRPSTPKVPPLKIIIPPKSQAISTPTHTNERLKVGTKSALPYVINPYQDQDREADAQPEESGLEQTQPNLNTYLQPVQNPSYLDVPSNSDSEYVMNLKKLESDKNSDENVDMEIDYSEVNSVKPSQDNELDDKEDTKSDSDSKKDENKKDEPTQRVLRSTVRSQQLSTESKPPKQQKQPEKPERSSNSESPSFKDDTAAVVATSNPTKEEEDICLHPRKRKVKSKPDSTEPIPQGDGDSPVPINSNLVTEKVPNPFEIYISLRKKIASRRRGYLDMLSICPKTPQGFKDYLLKTCNYVLQGNTTSTLSVPTLSPPNSVKDKMRDQFVQQEKARYKLRLQHLIEREKLILSIEQEILREHGRAARAIANQGTPLSVCTILRDEEIYNFTEDQEEKDKKNRTRYNGRQFLSWIQDVDDKYEKIKELLILRQKQEADSLYAYQRLEWEWRLKELSMCERNVTPEIDELHVPLVTVQDNFDLLPT
ncbi:ankyrin repeat domain-containing protein 12-like isoform X2 [Mercenaria mercenaria]|uniref:ankyrin repeat domain-containing protein 12-like isoform X2 n=1 Tax=Mercenaria mercenaria TaxID=6596 RepID=UPI00234F86BB|nr:ankyrin repeat domain-containing protein 12-like isoform X2 [Mercenaria mercenaria]